MVERKILQITNHNHLNKNNYLAQRVNEIPNCPGCYLMKDKDDRILYIGKSKCLRSRVRSYFRNSKELSPRIDLMIRQVVDIEIIVTDNEAEALVLESNLIKSHQPYFNVLLKDDKKYPYLCITWSEKYPRIFITRRRRQRRTGDRFYGPYVDVGLLRRSLFLVKRVFPLRQRPLPLYKNKTCLNYSIKRCPGVCQELITPDEYQRTLKKVEMVFQGRSEELISLLKKQMEQYSNKMEYEKAAKVRDQLNGLKDLTSEQKMSVPDSAVSRDVIALSANQSIASIQLFQMRGGKLVGRLAFTSELFDSNFGLLLQRIIEEYYSNVQPVEIPPELIIQYPIPQSTLITNWLSDLRGRKVKLNCPKVKQKADLIALVEKNAKLELERSTRSTEIQELALEDLAQLLQLINIPKRIEGYDISHIQGSDAVGSQVVFIDGLAAKQHYRKYIIKDPHILIGHSDDYLSLKEVIRRRFKKWSRLKEEGVSLDEVRSISNSKLITQGYNDWPDLIMIDGGKGQLAAVTNELRTLGLEDEVNICSLAKRNEEVYIPALKSSLDSEPNQLGVQLLRRVRDEAHRFALNFHRQKRTQRMRTSALADIPGLGPKRIKDLLNHFNSIDSIQLASIDELSKANGLGKSVAKEVWKYFHTDSTHKQN